MTKPNKSPATNATTQQADPALHPRKFTSKGEMDAATIAELIWPACLSDILRDPEISKAGAVLAYQQYLAASGAPADPVERILLEEIWLAHYRVADLQLQASKAASAEASKLLSSAAVRLMGEVRRTALAIRQYRLPPGQKSFTVQNVSQQNVASRQDVQYVDQGSAKETLLARDKVGDSRAPEGDLHAERERINRGQEPPAGGSGKGQRTPAAALGI